MQGFYVKDVPSSAHKISVIAAVDKQGGYTKDGKIPWHYPDDFKWFREHTKGAVCIMGRTTYEDTNCMIGDKGKENVLPGRKCFVVSSTLTDLPNATVIRSIREYEEHIDASDPREVFILGGYKLFIEGVALADTVYLTIINKDYECDKTFPVEYVTKHFLVADVHQVETSPDLRFITWTRAVKR